MTGNVMKIKWRRLILCLMCSQCLVFIALYVSQAQTKIVQTDKVTMFLQVTNVDARSNLADETNLSLDGNEELACAVKPPDPFTPDAEPFIKSVIPIRCNNHPDKLTYVDDMGKVFMKPNAIIDDFSTCNYQELIRHGTSDSTITVGKRGVLKNGTQMHNDLIHLTCSDDQDNVLYETLHWHTPLAEKFKSSKRSNRGDLKLNVLIIINDGMSLSNTIRQLPRTYAYLTNELKATTMRGYNIVGSNTFPNLIPLLTGQKATGIHEDPNNVSFIWKDFSEKGYATYYNEDSARFATFNYVRNGFEKPPTDIYARPLWLAIDAMKQSGGKKSRHHCFRETPVHKIALDYLRRFTINYKETPYFALHFLNELSHDRLNDIQLADKDYLDFLVNMKSSGSLNNTILIFASDHGNRFSDYRTTKSGRLEYALPTLSFAFPLWFRRRFPKLIKVMEINSNRIITAFDVHATIKDILYSRFQARIHVPDTKGLSLFGVIPAKRTCESAGIPLTLCVCKDVVSIDENSKISRDSAAALVKYINKKLEPVHSICDTVRLKRIVEANRYTQGDYIFIQIVTEPGSAMYEAAVQTSKTTIKVLRPIIRLNMYGTTADCIKSSAILRTMCYCKE